MSGPTIAATVREGAAARLELAEALATEFRSDPGRFEARRLERLGGAGLACFLRHVGAVVPETGLDAKGPSSPGLRMPERRTDRHRASGWSPLRRGERHYWLAGTFGGLRAGAVFAAVGLLFLLLTERVLPLIERSFS